MKITLWGYVATKRCNGGVVLRDWAVALGLKRTGSRGSPAAPRRQQSIVGLSYGTDFPTQRLQWLRPQLSAGFP